MLTPGSDTQVKMSPFSCLYQLVFKLLFLFIWEWSNWPRVSIWSSCLTMGFYWHSWYLRASGRVWEGLRISYKSRAKYARPTNVSQICHGVSNGTKCLCGQLSQVYVHIIIPLNLGAWIWSWITSNEALRWTDLWQRTADFSGEKKPNPTKQNQNQT